MRLYGTTTSSPYGPLALVASDAGLRAVLWPDERPGRVPLASEPEELPDHPTLVAACRQLEEYFAGERRAFELELDPSGTAFQREAWLALPGIPYGETTSYAAQAARLGRPRAARAVGAANGRNPLSIILPCHRVIGASGHSPASPAAWTRNEPYSSTSAEPRPSNSPLGE